MSNNSVRERLEPSVQVVAPVVVLFLVGVGRIVLGMSIGWPPHPITFIGMAAGTIGAAAVSVFGAQAYGQGTSPTTRFFVGHTPVFSDGNDRDTARWVVLFAGTIAGGAYPTVFHGILGLPSRYITHLYPAFVTAALWGVVLFCLAALAYLATGVLTLAADSRSDLVTFGKLTALYTATFGIIVGLSRVLWYPLLGI